MIIFDSLEHLTDEVKILVLEYYVYGLGDAEHENSSDINRIRSNVWQYIEKLENKKET